MNNTKPNILGSVNKLTTRRQALANFGLGALGLGALSAFTPTVQAEDDDGGGSVSLTSTDVNILNFALNLEYLEAEFYTYATTGAGIQALGIKVNGRGKLGDVIIKPNPQVPFGPTIQQYALEIAADEQNHVRLLRAVLGSRAAARPKIDLQGSFTAAAQAAGIIGAGQTFDPFADETSFLLAAFIFEDVGVTAYRGAAPLIVNKTILSAAAGLLGTEAYHASNIRAHIFEAGAAAQDAAQKISDLRDTLDGRGDEDQGVVLNGMANIVPTDAHGLVFPRTAAQVLAIVYFSRTATKGGFFPNGINTGN